MLQQSFVWILTFADHRLQCWNRPLCLPVAFGIPWAAGHMQEVVIPGKCSKLNTIVLWFVIWDKFIRHSVTSEYGLQLVDSVLTVYLFQVCHLDITQKVINYCQVSRSSIGEEIWSKSLPRAFWEGRRVQWLSRHGLLSYAHCTRLDHSFDLTAKSRPPNWLTCSPPCVHNTLVSLM